MKKFFTLSLLLISISSFAQINFNDYFFDKSLRIDYSHYGNSNFQSIALIELREEPFWGGSRTNLIDEFWYGNYRFEVIDSATNKTIFSKGYSTLFAEWLTTAEAKITTKSFYETITFPYPKKNVIVKFYTRNKENKFDETFSLQVNPSSPFIKKDRRNIYPVIKSLYNGASDQRVDIVIIPEGYTKDQMPKFKDDLEKFKKYLFSSSPFKENQYKFNIWGVEAPSADSGTDIPRSFIWRNTIVNSNFYTFDVERYLMTDDYKTVADLAANAPYDQIYILVNTDKYGGGAIYNHYSVTSIDNKFTDYVLVHEFGHGFAGLGDEYYTSEVAYEEFYKPGVEPWEPNLTTLTDFKMKWENKLDKNIPIPTPPDSAYKGKLGVFEGGGYVAKGVYRPMFDCTMKSRTVDNFCIVCKDAILKMIDYYCK